MPFLALALDADGACAEALADALLDAGALCADLADARAGTPDEEPVFDEPGAAGTWRQVRLTALFAAGSDPRQALAQACRASGLPMPEHRLAQVGDDNWVEASRRQFAPVRISPRLWIVPSWHEPPDPGAVNVTLDPGMAFGSGSHATTRLCLAWLQAQVRGGESVLDYGCGSGILAIAALKLGAHRALGVDLDPLALAAARANAARNGVEAEFLPGGSTYSLQAGLVVSNILANPLKMLAPKLAQHCAPRGRLALAGVLAAQAGEVQAAYAPWFRFEAPAHEDDWVCLSGVRR